MQVIHEISSNTRRSNIHHPIYANANHGLRYKSELANIGRGLRVKFHRIQQGMSLKELASGNLSQENLRLAEMSQFSLEDKIYKKLCFRLGIPLEPYINPIAEKGILEFKSMLTHIKNRAEMVEEYVRVMGLHKNNLKEVYRLEWMVHSIRYHIVTGDDVAALELFHEAEKYKDLMNNHQIFFLNKYRGNIHYAAGDYKQAIDMYKGCLTAAPLDIPTAEMADLLYSLAVGSAQAVLPQDAISYAERALVLYQDMFYPKRIVECHVCISLAEHRVRNFKSGMNHLTKASMILEEVDLPNLRYLIEYNFGYYYFQFQDFEATIRHTEKCLEIIDSGNVIEELRCYTTLIKSNLELGREAEALNWGELGTQVIQDMESDSLSNKSVLEVFNQFQLMKALLYDNHERFEYLSEDVLQHLEQNGYDIDHAYYCTLVADYYSRVGKSDHATRLYRKAGEIYRKVISIN